MSNNNEQSGYAIRRYRGGLALVWYDEQGKRHRHSIGTSDPREAERQAPALFAELTARQGDTVESLWNAYISARSGRAIVTTMRYTWRALAKRFGPMTPESITTADCRAHINERRNKKTKQTPNGVGDGTIHTELGHLRMVLVWAENERYIDKAPHIERPSKPKPSEKHLTKIEAKRSLMAQQRHTFGCSLSWRWELARDPLRCCNSLGTAATLRAVLLICATQKLKHPTRVAQSFL